MHPSTISSGSGSPFSFHQTGAANDDDRHRLEHQHEQHDLHAHGNLHADHFQEESHMDDQDAMKQLQQRGHANTDVQALHFERPQALAIEQNTLIGHGSAPLFDNMSGGGFLSPMTTELVSATAAFSSTSPLISTRQQWAAESRGAPVPTLTENTSPSTSAAETEGASISSGERGDGANAATASTDYYAAKNQMERAKVLRAIAAPAIAGHHSTTLSTDFSTLTLQLLSNQLYSASVNHGEAAGNQNADQLEQQSGSSSSSSSNSTHGAVLQPAVNEKGSRLQSTAPSASSQAAGGAFTQTDAMETSGDAGKRSRCNMHLRTKKIRGGSEQLAIDELALRAFHALEDDATRREHSRHERKRSKTSSYTSAGSGSDQGHDRMPALFEMGSAAGFFQHESANIDHDIDRDADDDESPSDDEFEDDDADEISAGAMAAEALEASVDGDFDGDSDAGSPDPEFESAMNAFKIRSVQLSKEEAGRAASKRKRSQGNSRKKSQVLVRTIAIESVPAISMAPRPAMAMATVSARAGRIQSHVTSRRVVHSNSSRSVGGDAGAGGSRRKSGGYKRSTMCRLMTDEASHEIVDALVLWPEMEQVYVLSDYRLCLPDSTRSSKYSANNGSVEPPEHRFRRGMRFVQGRYTQSTTVIDGSSYTIRQTRCNGVRVCDTCGIEASDLVSARTPKCSQDGCDGKYELSSCNVTVFYLFSTDDADTRRWLVCIPDNGCDGHTHGPLGGAASSSASNSSSASTNAVRASTSSARDHSSGELAAPPADQRLTSRQKAIASAAAERFAQAASRSKASVPRLNMAALTELAALPSAALRESLLELPQSAATSSSSASSNSARSDLTAAAAAASSPDTGSGRSTASSHSTDSRMHFSRDS